MNQAIDKRTSGTGWSRKALATCLMVVATLLAACLMAAQPAHASTTFTVNSTGDDGDQSPLDNVCDASQEGGECTLRAAIQQANATSGADTINFNIPGTGVQTIHVNCHGLRGAARDNGASNDKRLHPARSLPNTLAVGDNAILKVELDGTNVPSGNSGLEISTADSSMIKGLVINRFTKGIAVRGDSVANRIEGNFVGTDPSGTLDRGNDFHAVVIANGPSQTVVGGTTLAARNILSGNNESNLVVSNSNGNQLQGNYVGTDKSGTKALGNGGNGVFLADASGTVIGGTTASSRNVISGNNDSGIVVSAGSQETKVLGNRIGTTADGTGALGNAFAGVLIVGSDNLVGNGTSAGSNTIAFNGGDGIAVSSSTASGNVISRNSIFSNGGLGIDLSGGFEDAQGNTANDPGDIDTGPNGLQNKPVISSAKSSSTKSTITGKLNSNPELSHLIQFFSNPSGTNEGRKFLGQKSVTTGADGKATFTFSPSSKVAVGQTITATATFLRASNTSEFSAPRTVASS